MIFSQFIADLSEVFSLEGIKNPREMNGCESRRTHRAVIAGFTKGNEKKTSSCRPSSEEEQVTKKKEISESACLPNEMVARS